MQVTRKLNDDIFWVGADDRRLHLFENMYPIPHGVSYNAYVIMDEKTALMDTVDESAVERLMENLSGVLGERMLDYVIVNHMEPDHCRGIVRVLERYPNCKMVGNINTFKFYNQFNDTELPEERKVVVKEGDTLSLGKHELQFVFAPMVHWPEVMMSYEKTEKILFSADAFGTFGTLDGNLFADEIDFNAEWLADARRYYTNIVGKYGMQTQNVLKKASGIEIRTIAPLHGPVWRGEEIGFFVNKYDIWSSYRPEDAGSVAVFYASMYGDTQEMCEALACRLAERGVRNLKMYDVSKTDVSYLIAEAFRCEYLVFAAPTYNNGLYPKMKEFLEDMQMLCVQNRKVTVLGNGTWAPQSDKVMKTLLGEMKDMDISEVGLCVKSRIAGAQEAQLDKVAEDIAARLAK